MSINIQEILVANICGMVMIFFLLFFRIEGKGSKKIGEKLYNSMLLITLMALITETISFLIDGKQFLGCFVLQYVTNTICTGATVLVGWLWCLFVDFRIYRSIRRLNKKAVQLGIFAFAVIVCLIINLFGNGLVFRISADNVYTRSSLNYLIYMILFFYFVESIVIVYRSRNQGVSVIFFPICYFVIPCILGTAMQGIFPGIATGWLSVSMNFIFVSLEVQRFNAFVDDMSGLFNRKYMNYYLEKIEKTGAENLYGIMFDINSFKKINDNYGHLIGDRAIGEVGRILSESVPQNSLAMRMAGDEFVILMEHGSLKKMQDLKEEIRLKTEHFNETTDLPFELSMSTGIAKYDGEDIEKFMFIMDKEMYEEKKKYHVIR